MIGHLSGNFLSAEDGGILVDVAGVGYQVLVPARVREALAPGAAVSLHIHTNLRENALELYGFSTAWEKKVFHALTSVSGVGPRTAVTLLGALEPQDVLTAVLRGNAATLTSAPGVGKKTAERLVMELKDKAHKLMAERRDTDPGAPIGPAAAAGAGAAAAAGPIPPQGASASPGDLWTEAVTALVSLGYREADAVNAVRQVSIRGAADVEPSIQELIRASLQWMAKR